jgi:F-type H+-transporting ATPase subunit alpha
MRSEVFANQRKKERVMQLNPAEISELIKSRIEGLAASSDIRNQGTVVSVSDGIVRVHGLSDVMQGEMLEFPATKDGQPPTVWL